MNTVWRIQTRYSFESTVWRFGKWCSNPDQLFFPSGEDKSSGCIREILAFSMSVDMECQSIRRMVDIIMDLQQHREMRVLKKGFVNVDGDFSFRRSTEVTTIYR
jgi:hypothetical protein